MTGVTTDPNDPAIKRGSPDDAPVSQNEKYLVLSSEELAKGFVQPLRHSYIHRTCGTETRMGPDIAATYARDPWFYGATYCCACRMHRPLIEFTWDGKEAEMDPRNWSQTEMEAVMAAKEKINAKMA